jgi:hypothetical protein
MQGKETLGRACGAREIASGIFFLSPDKKVGLWRRIAGEELDVATLLAGLRDNNTKRDNLALALAIVLGVTLLNLFAAQGTTARHSRQPQFTTLEPWRANTTAIEDARC